MLPPGVLTKQGLETLPLPLLHSTWWFSSALQTGFFSCGRNHVYRIFFYDSGIQVPSPPLRLWEFKNTGYRLHVAYVGGKSTLGTMSLVIEDRGALNRITLFLLRRAVPQRRQDFEFQRDENNKRPVQALWEQVAMGMNWLEVLALVKQTGV